MRSYTVCLGMLALGVVLLAGCGDGGGPDVNPDNLPPEVALINSVRSGDTAYLEDFLDQYPDNVNKRGPDGLTLLHHAVHAGQENSVEVLLDHGADPLVPDDMGDTPEDYVRKWRAGPDIEEMIEEAIAGR